MKTISISNMKNERREIGEFPGVELSNGWKILEIESKSKSTQVTYYKEFWTRPGNTVKSKVMVIAGEWNPKTSNESNRFFVRGNSFSSDYKLFKYLKIESAEKKIMEIIESTEKLYEELYSEWINKYNFDPNKEEPENYEEPIWY